MKTIGLSLMILLPLFSYPAVAKQQLPPRATVFKGDLDLRTKEGATELRRRVDRTVIAISGGSEPQPGSLIPPVDLDEARVRGQDQADVLICAVRFPAGS